MKKRITRIRAIILSAVLLPVIAGFLAFIVFAENASAEAGDLSLVSITGGDNISGSASAGYTVYIRDGDETDVTLKMKNNSGKLLEYASIIDATTYGSDDDVFQPINFKKQGQNDPSIATDAEFYSIDSLVSETLGRRDFGYDIEAGKSPTFKLTIKTGDLEPGTYNWFVQFGRRHYVFEKEVYGTGRYDYEWINTGAEIDDIYSAKIPVKVVIYNQTGTKLAVGQNTGTDYMPVITPFANNMIDFGTLDLSSATDEQLSGHRDVMAVNDSAVNVMEDSHHNSTSIKVEFDGENTRDGKATQTGGAFTMGNGTLYDTNWSPLQPKQTEGSSTTIQTAEYTVSFYATDLIAGTYTGNLIVRTIPHNVKFNGADGTNDGVYMIPVRIKLTGTNPRLCPRATDLTATPANGYVELEWTPNEQVSSTDEYRVFRRDGTETATDPDSLDWDQYEQVGEIARGDNDSVVFIDADVENGKTYSYTVIAGQPYRGYASETASATPRSNILSQMLAPQGDANGVVGGVEVTWRMNDLYGGSSNDGSATVDYFNIYRDGVLIDRIYQSAVEDEVQTWNNNQHSYSWTVTEEVPQAYQPFTWEIAAVSPSGVESKRCVIYEEDGAEEEISSILSHNVWYDDYCYNEETDSYDQAILIYVQEYGDGSNLETIDVWRKEGTTPPDTSTDPYMSHAKEDSYSSDMHDIEDHNVTKGKTYTYSVQGIDGDGHRTNIYTFTTKADDHNYAQMNVRWKVVNSGTTARLNWYGDYNEETETYKVYRNNTLIKSIKNEEAGIYDEDEGYVYQNDPGSDGTYIYRVDRILNGITIKGREYRFVRDTGAGDINVLPVPDAPVLTARTSGDYNIILDWKASETGGQAEGFHIYRKDGGEFKTGYRMVTEQRWWGTDEVQKMWGNNRYISIGNGQERSFVDGSSGSSSYYKGDSHLGTIDSISWHQESMPHEYYITAYNRSGESKPSNVIVYDTHREDEYGNPIAPLNPAEDSPAAPTLKNVWISWEDNSSFRNGFDDVLYGSARVEWEDSGLGSPVDQWTATYAGTQSDQHNPPQTETVSAHQVILDPKIKLGTSDDSPDCMIHGFTGDSGDINRTVTATVTAKNEAGQSVSNEKSVVVRSIPRFYCLPGNGGAVLRWTDLTADDGSTVTGWEVWRKADYGNWKKVADDSVLPEPGEYAGTGKDYSNRPVQYYEWTDTDLDNNWKYEYKVVAKCDDEIDRPSVVREVTPTRSSATETPGAPTNLTAKVVDGTVIFTWTRPEGYENIYAYNLVTLKQNSGDSTPTWYNDGRTAYGGDSTGTTFEPSKPGTYQFAVYDYSYVNGVTLPKTYGGYEIDGYDEMTDLQKLDAQYPTHSNIVTVTITQAQINQQQSSEAPEKPEPTATIGDGQITLTWPACDYTTFYTVERENNAYPDIADVTIVTVPGQKSYTFTDQEALPGVKYRYIVSARNALGLVSTDLYATATGKTKDQKIAEQIDAMIAELPDPGDVSGENADQVRDAVSRIEEVMDTLTDQQKGLISPDMLTKLDEVNDALENICDHVWGAAVYQWAADHSSVTATHTCILNPKHKQSETVAAAGEVTKDPTCQAMGETTYTSEAFTKEGFEIQTITVADIPMTDHNWGEWETVDESTCTEYGIEKRVCADCGAEETRPKDKLKPHTFGDVHEGADPTCTEDGAKDYWVCAECGGIFIEGDEGYVEVSEEDLVIPALGHDWSKWEPYPDDPSTCIHEGQDMRTCGRCGLIEYRDAALLAHTLTQTQDYLAPTCEEPGHLACWTCEVCGGLFGDQDGLQQFESIDDTVTAPTGHDWQAPKWTWTGSDTKGYTAASAAFTCKNDKSHVETVDAELAVENVSGGKKYTARAEFDGKLYTSVKTVYADIPIYRLYNPKTKEHLFTASKNEYTVLPGYGWKQEGTAWYAPKAGAGIYRLYNPKTKDHHYTASANEAKVLTTQYGWVYDNNKRPLFYSGGNVPIYRLYNKKFTIGSHHLTKSLKEYNVLPGYGWKQEGIAMYATR